MVKKLKRSLLCAALLAASGTTLASQPQILSDAALDGVTAGYGYAYPVPATPPLSAAFAYAFTSASAGPGLNVLIDVSYSASVGVNQAPTSAFNATVLAYQP